MSHHEPDAAHSLMDALTAGNKDYIHFLKLDDEKRERVLTAAYAEFLENSYAEASTNTITKNAGISKGLLFHYFGSKEGLYQFLMKESARRIAGEALPHLPGKSGDVLSLVKSMIQLKIMVCLRFPRETNFLIAAWTANLPENLLQERKNMLGMTDNYFEIIVGLLDSSLLREGVEKEFAAELIAWIWEKYTDKVLSSGRVTTAAESWNRVTEDLEKYMDVLRRGLYK